ncbi:putative carbohydrate transporter [Escherichia coli]|uniref:Putative carbohydrate transporter n=1 Tax=Escherichia coli TaxID=562 RepID=A0A447X6H7_ECOLX|nr:putative carbohydrate transporter [Escherichia coli]
MKSEVLSVKEKIGYGMGDAASHIIFDNVMLYMMFFYTDIFGIPAGFVGTMFLVARALDAISDPCMGCWPIERALAGVNFVHGYCWRTTIRDRLCTGL